jgi:hypothetical protein
LNQYQQIRYPFQDSHLPLSCDEVERDSETQARTHLENAATEAMVRECVKCNTRFLQEDGCNKMTCQCGATSCYICRKPVADYSHFYGQGGQPEPGKFPLYTDNVKLHRNEVKVAVQAAKRQMNPGDLNHCHGFTSINSDDDVDSEDDDSEDSNNVY